MVVHRYFLGILAAFLINAYQIGATPVITMFLVPYPHDCSSIPFDVNRLSHPGKLVRHMLQNTCNAQTPVGILATYYGFISLSDADGEISFPLKHASPALTLVVTTAISPSIMHGNTISHWELDPTKPCEIYSFERIHDVEKNIMFWHVKPAEPLPDCKIPLDALIIIAEPEYVYIPTGISLAQQGTNIVLPDIYIKYGINKIKSDLYWLNIIHFFGPLKKIIKNGELEYQEIVAPAA